MVVSPAKGTFHLASEAAGLDGSPRRRDRRRRQPRDRTSVTAAHGGQVVEWLVEDGDPVSPGQPLSASTRRGSPDGQPSAPQGAPHAAILGIGAYRPSRIVPNADIVEAIDSSDEWIQQRSGIKQRPLGHRPRRPSS